MKFSQNWLQSWIYKIPILMKFMIPWNLKPNYQEQLKQDGFV